MISCFWLILEMLLGFSCTPAGAGQEGVATNEMGKPYAIAPRGETLQNRLPDGKQPPLGFLLDADGTQRLCGPRPFRQHSFGGGKPGRSTSFGESDAPLILAFPLCTFTLCPYIQRLKRSAPPRLYYVIALRRILC